jgi:hypothetical protein
MELETQIVKPELPSLELPNLETALATAADLSAQLIPMREKAQTLKVTDTASYQELGAILSESRNMRKTQIAPLFSPFNGIITRVKDFLKMKQQAAENTCQEIEAIALPKMKDWERQELEATAKEQKKLGEEVKVQPNLPSVGGYRRSTTYPVEVTDGRAILKAWYKAMKDRDRKRADFLQQFITHDEQALREYARELKDPAAFMKQIPGVKCRKD